MKEGDRFKADWLTDWDEMLEQELEITRVEERPDGSVETVAHSTAEQNRKTRKLLKAHGIIP